MRHPRGAPRAWSPPSLGAAPAFRTCAKSRFERVAARHFALDPRSAAGSVHSLAATPRIMAGNDGSQPWHDRLDEAVVPGEVLERVEVAHVQILVEPVAADIRPTDEGL